jgi:hypothetical protein
MASDNNLRVPNDEQSNRGLGQPAAHALYSWIRDRRVWEQVSFPAPKTSEFANRWVERVLASALERDREAPPEAAFERISSLALEASKPFESVVRKVERLQWSRFESLIEAAIREAESTLVPDAPSLTLDVASEGGSEDWYARLSTGERIQILIALLVLVLQAVATLRPAEVNISSVTIENLEHQGQLNQRELEDTLHDVLGELLEEGRIVVPVEAEREESPE